MKTNAYKTNNNDLIVAVFNGNEPVYAHTFPAGCDHIEYQDAYDAIIMFAAPSGYEDWDGNELTEYPDMLDGLDEVDGWNQYYPEWLGGDWVMIPDCISCGCKLEDDTVR